MIARIWILCCLTTSLLAEEIVVRAPEGDNFVVNIAPEETFQDVKSKINDYLELTPQERAALLKQTPVVDAPVQQKDMRIDYRPADLIVKPQPKPIGVVRDYNRPTEKEESKTIYYIVTTLGNKSIATIIKETSNLKRTRTTLNNLHPLRFAEVIFSNEELKAAVVNLKGRPWWSDFRKGLVDTLAEESKKQNLKLEYIQDFAQKVHIDPNLILPSLQKGKWDEFLNLLVDKVPRAGNPGKFDM